jgi:Mn-dependent DtxR family transcriptional regulator
MKRLKEWGLVRPERGNEYALTEKGRAAAKKAM